MRSLTQRERKGGGFSLVELLVTIVLAGIIFAAMVPLFVTALQKTSGDNFRVTSNNILQDRIENIRLLAGTAAGYASVTGPNLMSPSPNPIGDGRFGPTYYLTGSTKPYTMTYTVVDGPQVAFKTATVAVSWTESGHTITKSMSTNVKDPTADTNTSVAGGTPTWSPDPNGYSITASFKNWTQVVTAGHNPWGVVIVYKSGTPTPTVTVTVSPTKCPASASSPTVMWTGLPGGPAITYTVTCHSTYIDATSPAFHLLKNARLKFDTHPGGS
jgi:prepilin-type N-terminal cleavage/methylation domain-containing protein